MLRQSGGLECQIYQESESRHLTSQLSHEPLQSFKRLKSDKHGSCQVNLKNFLTFWWVLTPKKGFYKQLQNIKCIPIVLHFIVQVVNRHKLCAQQFSYPKLPNQEFSLPQTKNNNEPQRIIITASSFRVSNQKLKILQPLFFIENLGASHKY